MTRSQYYSPSDWVRGTGLDARREAPTSDYDWLDSSQVFAGTAIDRNNRERLRTLYADPGIGIKNPYSTPDYQPTIASSDIGFGTDFSDTLSADIYNDYATEARMAGDIYDDIFLTKFYKDQAEANKPPKKKSGIGGLIGSVAGMVIGNAIAPGIGGQIGGSIGGNLGNRVG